VVEGSISVMGALSAAKQVRAAQLKPCFADGVMQRWSELEDTIAGCKRQQTADANRSVCGGWNWAVGEDEGLLAPCYVGTLEGERPAWIERMVETDQVHSDLTRYVNLI